MREFLANFEFSRFERNPAASTRNGIGLAINVLEYVQSIYKRKPTDGAWLEERLAAMKRVRAFITTHLFTYDQTVFHAYRDSRNSGGLRDVQLFMEYAIWQARNTKPTGARLTFAESVASYQH